jgi:hypothetical protein
MDRMRLNTNDTTVDDYWLRVKDDDLDKLVKLYSHEIQIEIRQDLQKVIIGQEYNINDLVNIFEIEKSQLELIYFNNFFNLVVS